MKVSFGHKSFTAGYIRRCFLLLSSSAFFVAASLSSLQIYIQLRPYNKGIITQQNEERRAANGFQIFGHFEDLIYKNRILFS